jgi:hypothetical protein
MVPAPSPVVRTISNPNTSPSAPSRAPSTAWVVTVIRGAFTIRLNLVLDIARHLGELAGCERYKTRCERSVRP